MRHLPAFAACLFALIALPAAPAAPEAAPVNAATVLADNILDTRLAIMESSRRFSYLNREFQRTPQNLSIKARYAESLILGETGAPKGGEAEGVALARETAEAGNSIGLRALGVALGYGKGVPKNRTEAIGLLRRADDAGNLTATARLGLMLIDEEALDETVSPAEECCRRAARRGLPEPLFKLGMIYEKDSSGYAISISRAAALLNEAAKYGSYSAYDHLRKRSKEKVPVPELLRAYYLSTLRFASLGSNMLQTPRVAEAAKKTEALYPEDPEALFVLGVAYRCGEYGLRDMKRAWAFLDKAAALGSDDARSERAAMLAEGMGVKKDQAAAIAEWRLLEKQNHAGALANLGYYSFWGSLDEAGIPKDAAKCFDYSKRAADQGDYFGQLNISQCYAFGIGTERNYALAAGYCLAGAQRGSKRSYTELPKLISAAFD